MVSGSLASSLRGEPRASHDIDLVVEISPADVPRLSVCLAGEPRVFFDEQGALASVGHGATAAARSSSPMPCASTSCRPQCSTTPISTSGRRRSGSPTPSPS